MQTPMSSNNIFSPSQAIRSSGSKTFSGRVCEVVDALDKLNDKGSSLIVIGDRGIGKTSFGAQLYNLLSGDHTFLTRIGQQTSFDKKTLFCVWLECQQRMLSLEGALLQLLLSTTPVGGFGKSFYELFPDIFKEDEVLASIEALKDLSSRFLVEQEELQESSDMELKIRVKEAKNKIFATFELVTHRIKKRHPSKDLMIFFDEFDRIDNKTGIGELIKSSNHARYVIIGIADTLEEILQDHLSVERKAREVQLPSLKPSEIDEFFTKCEEEVSDRIKFSSGFRKHVKKYCSGFPFLIQDIGNQAFIHVTKSGNFTKKGVSVIDRGVFEISFQKLLQQDRFRSKTRVLYDALKQERDARFEVLKAVAKSEDKWVSSKQVSRNLPDKIGKVTFHLSRLVSFNLIVESKSKTYKFSSPIYRAIIKFLEDTKGDLPSKLKSIHHSES